MSADILIFGYGTLPLEAPLPSGFAALVFGIIASGFVVGAALIALLILWRR